MIIPVGTATKVRFGDGARHELADHFTDDDTTTLIIASASSQRRGLVAELIARIASRTDLKIWDRVSPNPRTEDIDACLEAYAGHRFTHVVGLGGGSALDQAKATAMALQCAIPMGELLSRRGTLPSRENQLILLPTTAGTGAELSYGAILTRMETGEKLGLRGEQIAADLALVDPELTHSASREVSMVTGFDVFTHALETWLSTAATPYTKDLSRGAITRVFEWLPVVYNDPLNATARREMSYASMVMGINLALATTCLPHRLQYPIGAATDTAHAAGLAAIYPAWLNHVLPHARNKLAECAAWIGLPASTDPARAFVDAVLDLQVRVGLAPSLADLGVTADMVVRFPKEVTGRLDTDPGYSGPEDLASIYQAAFAQ